MGKEASSTSEQIKHLVRFRDIVNKLNPPGVKHDDQKEYFSLSPIDGDTTLYVYYFPCTASDGEQLKVVLSELESQGNGNAKQTTHTTYINLENGFINIGCIQRSESKHTTKIRIGEGFATLLVDIPLYNKNMAIDSTLRWLDVLISQNRKNVDKLTRPAE